MKINNLKSIKYFGGLIGLVILFATCQSSKTSPLPQEELVRAVDISRYPEIRESATVFYNAEGEPQDFLDILKTAGVNSIRLKLWVKPIDGHSGFQEVKTFAEELRGRGFKIWLTLHYSDTWAHPGQQITPSAWQGITWEALKDSVYQYTEKVSREIQPDIIQIGNELNTGFLHPTANLDNLPELRVLLSEASAAVRESRPQTKIMLHYAGLQGAEWFFHNMQSVDYDQIGISYYPIWHGKDFLNLENTLQSLSKQHGKEVLIAETAYPFTLAWNDWTNNIVGLESQLVLPDFPASPQGQKAFLLKIRDIVEQRLERGKGFCYWGAELIAWRGNQAQNASSWENQAIFDFQNRALPVLDAFSEALNSDPE